MVKIEEVKTKLDAILTKEVEKKIRFLKQTYYEGGPKVTKSLARQLINKQQSSTIYKIRDPVSKELMYNPREIERAFDDYYTNLYKQPTTADEDTIKTFLNSLDLLYIGSLHNAVLCSQITEEELDNAIKKIKTNKIPGTDGFPIEWYKTFKK